MGSIWRPVDEGILAIVNLPVLVVSRLDQTRAGGWYPYPTAELSDLVPSICSG